MVAVTSSRMVARQLLRLWRAVLLALAMAAAASAAQAQSTYSYTGAVYAGFTNFTTCQAGDCEDFLPGQNVSVSFQTASPLAPNLSSANIASLVTSFSATDGLTTYSSAEPQSYVFRLIVSTDVTGAMTSADVTVLRDQTATLAAAPGSAPFSNPNTKLDSLVVAADGTSFARHNATCDSIGVAPSGRLNSCLTFKLVDPGISSATASAPVLWVSPPPMGVAAVPTLSEWAMILLGLTLAGYAALTVASSRVWPDAPG